MTSDYDSLFLFLTTPSLKYQGSAINFQLFKERYQLPASSNTSGREPSVIKSFRCLSSIRDSQGITLSKPCLIHQILPIQPPYSKRECKDKAVYTYTQRNF